MKQIYEIKRVRDDVKWDEIPVLQMEYTRQVCQVVPCGLTESVGDIAALTVADYYYTRSAQE